MPALLELQRAFATSMLHEEDDAVCGAVVDDGFAAAERLRIYRNTCRSTLIEALRMTYPALDRLVGRDFFDMAAARYAGTHPPQSGYLNEYGGEFPEFLVAFGPASELPYLADVARFEWALGVAANAADAPVLDPLTVAALDPQGHAALRFEPHPSVSFLTLGYPADQIADAVLAGDEAAMGRIDLKSGPVRLVVHRGPDGVEAERLEPGAYEFVSRLCAGEALGRLLESAPADDAPLLLAAQLRKGRLTACHS